jgi:alpha-L-rhamnosidase
MWYVLEVEDYLTNRNTSADKELFRESIYNLLAFYARNENGDGLLEDLPSWNFVEWSKANQWTRNVNYPTNFLYAQVLEAAYKIYGDEALHQKAENVRRETIAQSFNGRVFLDHAVRDENGNPVRLDDCSEACQYYAILFGGFDLNDAKYAELKRLVTKVFTPSRTEYPEIHPVNAFIGAYLRLEVLMKLEEYDILLSDIVGFFGHMGESTATLWEYRERHGSRDHGFASLALVAIRKALGIS